jgi:hypothetical protein
MVDTNAGAAQQQADRSRAMKPIHANPLTDCPPIRMLARDSSPAPGSEAFVDAMIRDCTRTRQRWESWARWPAGVMGNREQNSMDEHDTREQAEAVCRMLERDGFGCAGTIFPIATWVLPPNNPDQGRRAIDSKQ